jgi:hypothetical protein
MNVTSNWLQGIKSGDFAKLTYEVAYTTVKNQTGNVNYTIKIIINFEKSVFRDLISVFLSDSSPIATRAIVVLALEVTNHRDAYSLLVVLRQVV